MEKYSKWRDASTGIQPFLPPVPPSSVSPVFIALLGPFSFFHAVARSILLAVVALLHLALQTLILVLVPLPPLYYPVQNVTTFLTGRLALCLMGYWWIDRELVSSKRAHKAITQIANRKPSRGDLIISNWTGYVDIILLSTLYNPVFLLPVYTSLPDVPVDTPKKFGRQTGTGSANINVDSTAPWPSAIGYIKVPFWALLSRTGQLPPISSIPPEGMYKTLREARKKERNPVVLLPEGTTSNGRAILRFGEGVLEAGDVGGDQDGQVWIKYLRHSAPSPFAPTATCSLPEPLRHLFFSLLWTPTPFPSRTLSERTLHPSASPSSPSFLPGEILRDTPGGLEAAGRGGTGAWREACGIVLAETGRTRRVKLGWVEKEGFFRYWASRR